MLWKEKIRLNGGYLVLLTPLLGCGIMPTSFGWVRRGRALRTVSDPKGSSTKEDPLGAAGVPARSFFPHRQKLPC